MEVSPSGGPFSGKEGVPLSESATLHLLAQQAFAAHAAAGSVRDGNPGRRE
jgi:predicted hotdog family 3-hydroxylacyl-ACP dehydratase